MHADPALQPLVPGPATTPAEAVAGLGLRDGGPDGRPRVAAVMIAAPDGRAAVAGRSGGLGSPADRAVLRAVREQADALLVGAATLRAERYGNVLDADQIAARTQAGRTPTPPLATISRDLARLPVAQARIFAEPGAPVLAYTASPAGTPVPDVAADLQVVRLETVTPAAVLADLHARGVGLVVTEGGPTLLRTLAAEGLLDDLVLTVAPFLVGGDGIGLLAGNALPDPLALRLAGAHRAGDHLFLHYRA